MKIFYSNEKTCNIKTRLIRSWIITQTVQYQISTDILIRLKFNLIRSTSQHTLYNSPSFRFEVYFETYQVISRLKITSRLDTIALVELNFIQKLYSQRNNLLTENQFVEYFTHITRKFFSDNVACSSNN